MSENLNGALQENILTLLCFDEKSIPLIISNISVDLFESSIYREIASQAINFHNEFKKPVGEHLSDVLEHILQGKDKKKAELYGDVLVNLYEARTSINSDYVLTRLNDFVRRQNLRFGIKEAIEKLNDNKVEEAEAALDSYKKTNLSLFDAGLTLQDTLKSFQFLRTLDESFKTGIEVLDRIGACPAPKELFVFLAPPNAGKTWFLIYLAKCFLAQRKKVLHITLEMSQDKISMRYFQSFFSIAKHKDKVCNKVSFFEPNQAGLLSRIQIEMLSNIKSFDSPDIEDILRTKLSTLKNPQLIIKEFPTSSLTLKGLKAYLDNLEMYHNFIPDVLLLDYADLMHLDAANLRLDTSLLYKQLRGLAVERNMAVITPSQTNRGAGKIKLITRDQLAEDFTKVAIADNLITFNQTPLEHKKGLARLYVDKARNDIKGDIILISQNYTIGQFCLDSIKIGNDYWDMIGDSGLDNEGLLG